MNNKRLILWVNIAVAIFLLLNQIAYRVWPEGFLTTLLGAMWELCIIPIIGFMLFCAVFLLIKLYRKDFSGYTPVLFWFVLNIFLLIILPYLIE